jgi:hypothetical protein
MEDVCLEGFSGETSCHDQREKKETGLFFSKSIFFLCVTSMEDCRFFW